MHPASGRSRTVITRALFDPPPFKPEKLTVTYSPGTTTTSPAPPSSRRYTLTHNDITGELQLTVGRDYNQEQISGFYTRLLRDEVVAEWQTGNNGSGTSLHIYCHVSGEEKWLAPPVLRNYIFRREMPLVLECVKYADQQLLDELPHLARARVYVHFQSTIEALDSVECWGILGERSSWQQVPTSIMKRLLFGLVGLPVEDMKQQSTSPDPCSTAVAPDALKPQKATTGSSSRSSSRGSSVTGSSSATSRDWDVIPQPSAMSHPFGMPPVVAALDVVNAPAMGRSEVGQGVYANGRAAVNTQPDRLPDLSTVAAAEGLSECASTSSSIGSSSSQAAAMNGRARAAAGAALGGDASVLTSDVAALSNGAGLSGVCSGIVELGGPSPGSVMEKAAAVQVPVQDTLAPELARSRQR